MAPSTPSQAELERRKLVSINAETVTDTISTDYPGHFPGEDNSWDCDEFARNLQVVFHDNQSLYASFSLIGVDASIANAFRRIIISEIPTLAIEDVFIENNTSVIQDEVLAHRLGLIPFKGNKEGIVEWLKWFKKPEGGADGNAGYYDYNTVSLALQVKCTHNDEAAEDEADPLKAYHHAHVYARDIVFTPIGRQSKVFHGDGVIAPTNPDILIAKLRPGQVVDLTMHMHKGIGAEHAKFSPVATASYRLMPTITITRPILGADADKFAKCFPAGVIGLEKVTKKEARQVGSGYEGHEGETKAVVVDPMKDTVSRECLRHEEFHGKVKLGRRRDHFIYSIESTGQWPSDELFLEAVKVLKVKCEKLHAQVINMVR
ncbi:insert subdomain of RNA polymerase alpha subunit [Thozetella sp. PMI_491]|nr:insert subdomain of RNA polymerase alpha subunit [Thozetella sp. PMI_491]